MKHLLNTLKNNSVYQQVAQTMNSLGYDLGGKKQTMTIKHPIMNQIASAVAAEPDFYVDAVPASTTNQDQHDYPEQAPTHHYQLRLRLATIEDLPAIAELECVGYDGYMAWELYDFERDWRTNPYAVYMVLENVSTEETDEAPPLVGMVTGRFLVKKAHISHLIIHPDFQGHGLGDYLLNQWLTLAKRVKVRQASLEVRESNFAAQQLYYKNGFTLASKKHNYYYNNHETAFYLVRSLT